MQIDFIRRDTPEEISEEGGAFIQIVNKDTLGLTTSIDEAKSSLYVVGANSMIEGYFVGIMRSVFEGIKEDGHPRTVGDITIYPVCGGTFDLEKGWDPLVNDVRIKARLGSGVTLDITNWTFRDVTTGRVSFSIDTISDGTTAGIVSTDKNVELNGRNFPAQDLLSISWVCGTKSGTLSAEQFTANVARITINRAAYSILTADDDGKEIVFTVKGCYNKATKTAIVKYVSSPQPEVTFAPQALAGTKVVEVECAALGALVGAQSTASGYTAPITVKRTGKADETVTFSAMTGIENRYQSEYLTSDLVEGETVTLEATVDPTSAYKPGKVTASCVAA